MIIVGSFNAIDGLVALFKDEVYVQTKRGLVVFDYTSWGRILLIIGALQMLAGFALMRGALWARVVAIGLIVLNSIAQITFITRSRSGRRSSSFSTSSCSGR